MFYFKNIKIDSPGGQIIEKAIRSFSLKRHTSLDFKSSSSYASEEKYFLGLESENDLTLTRLRTPFERFFPKVIIRFKKNMAFSAYQIRLSVLSSILFCIFLMIIIQNFVALFEDKNYEDLLMTFILFFIFLSLTLIEINLTKRRINKAIQATYETEFLNL